MNGMHRFQNAISIRWKSFLRSIAVSMGGRNFYDFALCVNHHSHPAGDRFSFRKRGLCLVVEQVGWRSRFFERPLAFGYWPGPDFGGDARHFGKLPVDLGRNTLDRFWVHGAFNREVV